MLANAGSEARTYPGGRPSASPTRPPEITHPCSRRRALNTARAYTVRSAAPITPAESPSRFGTIGVVSSSLKT